MNESQDQFSKRLFLISCTLLMLGGSFGYGVMAQRKNLQPLPFLRLVYDDVKEVLFPSIRDIDVSSRLSFDDAIVSKLPEELEPGLVVIAGDVVALSEPSE